MNYFFNGRNKPINRPITNKPNNIFHLSKVSVRTFYLTCYQCSRSKSFDSFVKKAIQYIALTNTCKQRFLKKPCSFQSATKSKLMGMQVSMNEEVPDLVLIEKEVDSVT